MAARNFLTKEEQQKVVEAIGKAENKTSGEIRLHLESNCKEDVLDRATYWFEKLEMHKTELRNGVLIYVATDDRKLAVLGDAGINNKVPENFWEDVKGVMIRGFKNQAYGEAFVQAIAMIGEKLVADFPVQSDDVNELTDDISFGK